MANPVLDRMTNAAADALSDTTHAGTGLHLLHKAATKSGDPNAYAQMMEDWKFLADLVALSNQGACVKIGAGLNVGVFALHYRIGATEYAFAGAATFALSAAATNYLYLDTDQSLKLSTSGWPGGDHVKIAKATTNGSTVTSMIDCRWMNFLIGIATAWSSVQAGADVDMNNKALKNVNTIWGSAESTLTLASDAVTPTQMLHQIDTQGGAGADDLATITADAAKVGRWLMLRSVNAARVVTVKSTGNIALKDGDYALDATDKMILLRQHTATNWVEVCRNFNSPGTLQRDVNANTKNITGVRKLGLATNSLVLEASGDAISITHSFHQIAPEGMAASDDLKTINGGSDGDVLILVPATDGQTIYVRDTNEGGGFGGGNISLATPGKALTLDLPLRGVLLKHFDGDWFELGRSVHRLDDLVGTGKVIPFAIGPAHYPGTLSDNQMTFHFVTRFAFDLRRAHGYVVTAPSGSSCVIDVLKNGASCFAAPANAINIAVGANEDLSDAINVGFAVGDRLSVKVISANGAVSATVSFEAYCDAVAQP